MAPSWTSASSFGGKVQPKAKNDGAAVSSTVSDGSPLPGLGEKVEDLDGGGRVATEVYPRDPDRGFWRKE